MTTGWPLREGRPSYGPVMRDERQTVDSQTEVNAAQMNQTFWQLGAMGLIAPKAVMQWEQGPPLLTHGNFAWDQTIYSGVAVGSLPSYITSYVENSTGNYTLTFDSQVLGRPDADGVQALEVLAFQFAIVDVNLITAGQRGIANVTLDDPQTFTIEVTRGGAPSDQPYTLVVF